jgi:hypothetical protein
MIPDVYSTTQSEIGPFIYYSTTQSEIGPFIYYSTTQSEIGPFIYYSTSCIQCVSIVDTANPCRVYYLYLSECIDCKISPTAQYLKRISFQTFIYCVQYQQIQIPIMADLRGKFIW